MLGDASVRRGGWPKLFYLKAGRRLRRMTTRVGERRPY